MSKRVTIFEPPPLDNSKAAIENVLDLTPISDIGPVRRYSLKSETIGAMNVTNQVHFDYRTSSQTPDRYGIPPARAVSTAAP